MFLRTEFKNYNSVGMGQTTEHLSSKHKALSSNLRTAKNLKQEHLLNKSVKFKKK
jgi:hypothetical protein